MKAVLRVFNLIIMALAAVATIFLFVSPTMSFNSNIALDVAALSKFIPETDYTGQIDVPYLLGTDVIHVGLSFKVTATQANRFMNGERERINEELLKGSIEGVVNEFYEPVELITEFTVKDTLKRILIQQVTQNVDEAIQKFKDNNPGVEVNSTTAEMMADVGMDDAYFTNFTCSIYDAMDVDHAPLDDVIQVMYNKIDEALALADESGIVDTSGYSEDAKSGIQSSLESTLTQLKLLYDDSSVKKISSIAFIYLNDYLKTELQSKVNDVTVLEQGSRTIQEYTNDMITLYVENMLPDIFYQIVGYTCLGMFIGMFVFAALWGILFLITLFRTFSNKPWTIFGPWFWLFGVLQLVLGVGLTVFAKFILPTIKIAALQDLPFKSFVLAPRTCALVPSLIFGACIILAIIYGFFKRPVKRAMKEKPTKKDLVIHEN